MLHGQDYPALVASMMSGTISWKTSQAGLPPQQTSPGGFRWEKLTWAGLWVGLGAGSAMGYSYSVVLRMSHFWAIVEGKGLLSGEGSYQRSTCGIQVPKYSTCPFTNIAMDFHSLSCVIKNCQEKNGSHNLCHADPGHDILSMPWEYPGWQSTLLSTLWLIPLKLHWQKIPCIAQSRTRPFVAGKKKIKLDIS